MKLTLEQQHMLSALHSNTMPTDTLANLGATVSAIQVLTPKLEYSISSIRKVNIGLGGGLVPY